MTKSLKELESIASRIRYDIIKMTYHARSGHPGGSLSMVEGMAALYFAKLNHDPKNPQKPDRDRVILSKGHAAPLLYAVLAEAGYFDRQELWSLRKLGSRLQGHPGVETGLPGIEVSTGSLGQGLSIANGIAISNKFVYKNECRTYCFLGDGEIQEGEVWEAAMTAAHYGLDNLCAIVDNNDLQIDGCIRDVMSPYPIDEKFAAFGFNVINIDGHSIEEFQKAYDKAAATKCKPSVIIAKTIKGKGVSFMENKAGWHGKAPNKELAEKAVEELGFDKSKIDDLSEREI